MWTAQTWPPLIVGKWRVLTEDVRTSSISENWKCYNRTLNSPFILLSFSYRYFRDQKIDAETDKRFKFKNHGKTLEIRPDVELEGEYKCEFKNKNHTVVVVTPPRIHLEETENCRIDLKSVHAYAGRKFRIDCKSNNQNIKYNMRWLKNGEEIKSEVTNALSLEMNNLKESAKANYTCQASNGERPVYPCLSVSC